MEKVFISYRRDGGAEMARLVRDALKKRGYRVFMDVEDLRSGPFNTALLREIESSSDVVAILTPNSLDRCNNDGDWLRTELSCAITHGRNVIPLMTRGFKWPASVPDDIITLQNYQGVEPSHDFFEASMDRLAQLITAKPVSPDPAAATTRGPSFQRPAIFAIIPLILGLVAAAVWFFKDASDLTVSVRARQSDRVPVIVRDAKDYNGQKVYFGAAKVDVVLAHNQKGQKSIHVSQLAVVIRKVTLSPDAESRYKYSVDVQQLPGAGITDVRIYQFELREGVLTARYVLSKDVEEPVKPDNILERAHKQESVTINKSGDDSKFEFSGTVSPQDHGLFEVSFTISYDVGEPKPAKTTMPVYVFQK